MLTTWPPPPPPEGTIEVNVAFDLAFLHRRGLLLRRASRLPAEREDVVCLPLAGAISGIERAQRGGARGNEVLSSEW